MNDPRAVQAGLRVQLLGGLRLTRGDVAVDAAAWPLQKAAALVAMLALAPEHRLSREQLQERLWPNAWRQTAQRNLRYALHVARRRLAALAGRDTTSDGTSDGTAPWAILAGQGAFVALVDPEGVQTDVEVFERAARRALAATAAAAADMADTASLGEALALYTDDLYAPQAEDEALARRREELRQTQLALLLALARAHAARGEAGGAVEALQRALRAEPAHEGARAELMRLYALMGDRQRALREFGQLRKALRRDLDAEPGPEAARLYDELVDWRFTRRSPGGALPDGTVVAAGPNPLAVAVHVASERVFVANHGGMTLTVIDARTDEVIETIEQVGSCPHGLAVDEAGERVFVANYVHQTVVALDPRTGRRLANVWTPRRMRPRGIEFDPLARRVYVTCRRRAYPTARSRSGDWLLVLDAETLRHVATVGVGMAPVGVVVWNPAVPDDVDGVGGDGGRIYVSSNRGGGGELAVIDGASLAVLGAVPSGGAAAWLALDKPAARLYAADPLGGSVIAVDLPSELPDGRLAGERVVAAVRAGEGVCSVAVDSAAQRAYAACPGEDAVVAIDTRRLEVVRRWRTGRGPYGLAVHPRTHRVYVANGGDSTETVLELD